MDAPRTVFLDADSLDPGDIDWTPILEVTTGLERFAATAPEEVAERIEGAEVVISNKVPLGAAPLNGAAALRLVCVAATGTNNVDLKAAAARGIPVCNVRDYATPAVAQHVFTLILALTTRLMDYHTAVRDGAWGRARQFCLLDFPIRELAGKRLGIVGYGVLGQAVARLGEAFGMEVLLAERPGGPAQPGRLPLREFLREADVISLHCPLTPATQGLIGAEELTAMRDDALLINTARGGLVDEAALVEALRAGEIGGAGFDVLTREPPPSGNPLLADDVPNLIVTPHTAWASRQSRQRLIDEIAGNILAFRRGEARNIV
jgi:glycerate dehydrogenase